MKLLSSFSVFIGLCMLMQVNGSTAQKKSEEKTSGLKSARANPTHTHAKGKGAPKSPAKAHVKNKSQNRKAFGKKGKVNNTEKKEASTLERNQKKRTNASSAASTLQQKTSAPSSSPKKVTLLQAKKLLFSTQKEQVSSGLKYLEKIASPKAIPLITARLQEGIQPHLVEQAIEVLVSIGNHKAAPTLIELCSHRRASIRKSAVRALGTLKIKKAYSVLIEALDDFDPNVRVAAIDALSQLGNRQAINRLYQAFECGIVESVKAIALLANQKDVDKLVGYLGEHPFSVLEPAFTNLLDKRTVPLRKKLQIISLLGENGEADVQRFLRDYLYKVPKIGQKKMIKALGEAIAKANQTEQNIPEVKAESTAQNSSIVKEAR